MGIYRLQHFIRQNKDETVSTMDLVTLAKSYYPGTMKIIVDFHCWETHVREAFTKSYQLQSGNRFVALYGGEYALMDAYMKKVISNLRDVNIELVFYLSAARGCSQQQQQQDQQQQQHGGQGDQLHPAWTSKFRCIQRRLSKCLAFMNGKIPFDYLGSDDIERPALQEVQNVITLHEAGCEFHMCLRGETQLLIARRLRSDKSAFGVFGTDTDFCVFPECMLLHCDYFDEEGDLALGDRQLPDSGPRKLMCGVVRSGSLCRLLQLSDHAALVEFSIIAGNRFTEPRLWMNSKGKHPRGKDSLRLQENEIRSMVLKWKTVENCPRFKQAVDNDTVKTAIRRSRLYYNLHLEELGHVIEPEDTYPLLVEGVEEGRLPSTLIAMYHGNYWHRMVVEDPSLTDTTADGALSGLRAYLYSLVLPPSRVVVREIGRGPGQVLDVMHVPKVTGIPIPSLAQVRANTFSGNRRLFELIMQHQDEQFLDEQSSYFTVHGNRLGFLCYLLRYFLLMNWNRNLSIKREEFFALVAWVLVDCAPETSMQCMGLNIVPSPRCVTLQSWFSCLYRTVYSFLGNLLDLTCEFPTPKDLFSGSLWAVLYTAVAVNDLDLDCREPRPLNVPDETLRDYSNLVRQVVKDNRVIVKDIVRDVFPFGPK